MSATGRVSGVPGRGGCKVPYVVPSSTNSMVLGLAANCSALLRRRARGRKGGEACPVCECVWDAMTDGCWCGARWCAWVGGFLGFAYFGGCFTGRLLYVCTYSTYIIRYLPDVPNLRMVRMKKQMKDGLSVSGGERENRDQGSTMPTYVYGNSWMTMADPESD
jgi:hypothetical protein